MVHVNNWELDVENINGFSRQTFTIMLITGWLTFFLSGALNFGYYLVHPRLELWMLQWIWNCFLLVVWTAPQTTWSTRWPTICVGPRGSCGRPTKVINRKSQIFFQPQCELLTLLDVGGAWKVVKCLILILWWPPQCLETFSRSLKIFENLKFWGHSWVSFAIEKNFWLFQTIVLSIFICLMSY